jgi:hypothetical protein
MTYWVYENWVAESKAVIHESTCRFCNDGSGTGRNLRGERNGKWHGAFGSLDEAEAAARQTGRTVRSHGCVSSLALSSQPSRQMPKSGAEQNQELTPISPAQRIQELQAFGFKLAGAWRLEPSAKGGVRFALETLQSERVVYAFVVDNLVEYIGICDSVSTTLSSRMSRYQNLVGSGTNERIVKLIKNKLSEGHVVSIYAMKPESGPQHSNLDVDFIKGLEFPLIERLTPSWNKRR